MENMGSISAAIHFFDSAASGEKSNKKQGTGYTVDDYYPKPKDEDKD